METHRAPAKPTVVHVLEAFAGGTERHLLDLVAHVPNVEHVVAVPSVHLGRSTALAVQRASDLGADVELVEMTRALDVRRNGQAARVLRSLLVRRRPALVHVHSSIAGAVGRIAALGSGIPVLYTPNGLSRSRWALTIEHALRGLTERMIAVSESEAAFALRHRLVEPDRLEVIPNGIELEPPPALGPPLRQRLGLTPGTPLVGSLGRLTWQKAPEVFVAACGAAAADRPDAHFLLIGAGPLEGEVQRALSATGLGERFHRLAELPDAATAIGELDVYVLASRFEGGPYTPLEAMRAGTPVVLTDADGNRDTIIHGESGLLVAVDDVPALGEAIAELLADERLRRQLARGGSARFRERFDVRAMGAAAAAVYEPFLRPS